MCMLNYAYMCMCIHTCELGAIYTIHVPVGSHYQDWSIWHSGSVGEGITSSAVLVVKSHNVAHVWTTQSLQWVNLLLTILQQSIQSISLSLSLSLHSHRTNPLSYLFAILLMQLSPITNGISFTRALLKEGILMSVRSAQICSVSVVPCIVYTTLALHASIM